MKQLYNLTKIAFLGNFSVNKKKKNQSTSFKTILLFGGLFLLVSIYYNFAIATAFKESNSSLDEYITFIFCLAGMLTLILSMTKISTTIYKTNDYEFLESIPVSKKQIVASKILSLYLLCLYEDIILCLPGIVFYGVFTQNIIGVVVCIIAMLFVSLIPILASSLLSYLFTLFTAKSKIGNVISIILYILFFVGIMMVSFSFSSGSVAEGEEVVNPFGDTAKKFLIFMPYMKWFLNSLSTKAYEILFFVAANIASAFLVIIIISLGYKKINTWLLCGSAHNEYKGTDNIVLTNKKALLKKEFQFIFRKPMYIVNSFLGPIISCALIIMTYSIMVKQIPSTDPDYDEVMAVMVVVYPYMALMFNSMMTSTSASISLERKNLEILKSYPVNYKDIINAKLKVGIIIPAVLNLITSTVLVIIIKPDILIIIEMYIYPIIASTVIACIGILCGLKWPKTEFDNETQVLKNSMAVNMTMLFSFLTFLVAVIIGATAIIFTTMHIFGLVATIVVYGVTLLIVRLITNNTQEKLFENIGN